MQDYLTQCFTFYSYYFKSTYIMNQLTSPPIRQQEQTWVEKREQLFFIYIISCFSLKTSDKFRSNMVIDITVIICCINDMRRDLKRKRKWQNKSFNSCENKVYISIKYTKNIPVQWLLDIVCTCVLSLRFDFT